MAIDRLNSSTVVSATTPPSSKASTAVATDSSVTKTAATPSGESVTLSDGAQQLQKITDKLNDQPTVNSARVAELKAAVADGSYTVDSTKVASKLLNFEAQR